MILVADVPLYIVSVGTTKQLALTMSRTCCDIDTRSFRGDEDEAVGHSEAVMGVQMKDALTKDVTKAMLQTPGLVWMKKKKKKNEILCVLFSLDGFCCYFMFGC